MAVFFYLLYSDGSINQLSGGSMSEGIKSGVAILVLSSVISFVQGIANDGAANGSEIKVMIAKLDTMENSIKTLSGSMQRYDDVATEQRVQIARLWMEVEHSKRNLSNKG